VSDPVSVLVVDSSDGGPMYAEFLRSRGFTAWEVATPEQALNRLRTHIPDVVVTDLAFEKSGFDGPAFIRDLRHMPALRNTPVIVVSGFVRVEDRLRARDAGANLFLIKPCLPDDLATQVNDAVATAREGRAIVWNWPDTQADRRRAQRRAS
jgi:CheY-like chemotaxis protein